MGTLSKGKPRFETRRRDFVGPQGKSELRSRTMDIDGTVTGEVEVRSQVERNGDLKGKPV